MPLIVSALVMNTITSSPPGPELRSRSTQGVKCRLPSLRVTVNLQVRAGSADTNSCHHPPGASWYAVPGVWPD